MTTATNNPATTERKPATFNIYRRPDVPYTGLSFTVTPEGKVLSGKGKMYPPGTYHARDGLTRAEREELEALKGLGALDYEHGVSDGTPGALSAEDEELLAAARRARDEGHDLRRVLSVGLDTIERERHEARLRQEEKDRALDPAVPAPAAKPAPEPAPKPDEVRTPSPEDVERERKKLEAEKTQLQTAGKGTAKK